MAEEGLVKSRARADCSVDDCALLEWTALPGID